MVFIVIASIAFIIYILVNANKAEQKTKTYNVHQTKDSNGRWLTATISLLEDKVFIIDAYSQKQNIPFSKISSVTISQGELQLRPSKKNKVYYSFTLVYKDDHGWDNRFNCISFSPMDNQKFQTIKQRINDELYNNSKKIEKLEQKSQQEKLNSNIGANNIFTKENSSEIEEAKPDNNMDKEDTCSFEIGTTNQEKELVISDAEYKIMNYEGCNDISVFARCNCGLFKRFDKSNTVIKQNIIMLISQYKCTRCGTIYNCIAFNTGKDAVNANIDEHLQKDELYNKLVNLLKAQVMRMTVEKNTLFGTGKKSLAGKTYKDISNYYNSVFANAHSIDDIIKLYINSTHQDEYFDKLKLRYLSMYLFMKGNTYRRLLEGETRTKVLSFLDTQKVSFYKTKKSDNEIVEEYLKKPKETDNANLTKKEDTDSHNVQEIQDDCGTTPAQKENIVYEFNDIDKLDAFAGDDIKIHPQNFINIEEASRVLVDEKTRCFCPECQCEQTYIIKKNSNAECLYGGKIFDANFILDFEDNNNIGDLHNQPQNAYLNEDYYFANRACENEINNIDDVSAVEITINEDNTISTTSSFRIPKKISHQEIQDKAFQNNTEEYNHEYQKDEVATSNWSSAPEISFEFMADSYFESNEEQFYKQAKRWEKRTEHENVEVEFMQYRPTYSGMTDEQLKWYFTWRKNVREGVFNNTSLSYIYLYIYELINQVGVKSTEDGLKRIIEAWKQLRVFHKHLDRYLIKWIRDYIIYYGAEENYFEIVLDIAKDEVYELIPDEYLMRIFEKKETLCLLQFMNMFSGYKVLKSKFIEAGYGEIVEKCFADVLNSVNNSYIQSTGKPLLEEFINMNQVYKWNPFAGAVFYKENNHYHIKKKFINRYTSYWSENGGFYSSYSDYNTWHKNPRLKNFISDLLKCAETHLRLLLGYKGKLKYDSLPIDITLLIQKVVQANYYKYHSSEEKYITNDTKKFDKQSNTYSTKAKKQEFVIDVTKLDLLRKESDEIRKKLIEEQGLEEDGLDKIVLESYSDNEFTETKVENASNEWLKFIDSLDIYQKEALNVILLKHNVNEQLSLIAQKKLIMREMIIESINEVAFECIGDNLVDTSDEIPVIFDDYMDDILSVISMEV